MLHEQVLIVSVRPEGVPYVKPSEQLTADDLGYNDDGIMHLTVRYGFFDTPDLPAAVEKAAAEGLVPSEVDTDDASYFLSRGALRRTAGPGWPLAQAVVHRAGAQRRRPGRELRPAGGARTVIMGSDVDV